MSKEPLLPLQPNASAKAVFAAALTATLHNRLNAIVFGVQIICWIGFIAKTGDLSGCPDGTDATTNVDCEWQTDPWMPFCIEKDFGFNDASYCKYASKDQTAELTSLFETQAEAFNRLSIALIAVSCTIALQITYLARNEIRQCFANFFAGSNNQVDSSMQGPGIHPNV